MIKATASLITIALLAGCAGHVQNPVDRVTFRDEPLVKDVRDGMTRAEVLTMGGEPSATSDRVASPGTCNDYILSHKGDQQPYFVSFDANGRVDGKGFLTCRQMDENQRARRL
ncbi:osmotically-inducible lipoprotein OsmE [Stutzerimonas nosocomialis]|uniref:osmotically-inducible lipoprotein OsmE n=1 Tax=Stutzerimonas nosocomialis TaxID=1056496 RepID=UPI0011094A1B|nr:osmotically-inducible lipoprotein OsmE [Stutzerimonas nosocomialis]TLX57457.1 osmotically-inducible lipoprotein OsmE [Stutzerimonas nosocomialis]